MPNIKSASKRDALSKQRNAVNRAAKSELRSNLKKFEQSVKEGDRDSAVSTYKVAVKSLDKAAAKNLIHKNNAANKKSKLTIKLNGMAQ